MKNQSSNIPDMQTEVLSASVSKLVQLASAFLLGFVLLYGAGFVQTSVAHNASHDVRHAQAFPCH
jgi:cobalt transporter subunit CbtB